MYVERTHEHVTSSSEHHTDTSRIVNVCVLIDINLTNLHNYIRLYLSRGLTDRDYSGSRSFASWGNTISRLIRHQYLTSFYQK